MHRVQMLLSEETMVTLDTLAAIHGTTRTGVVRLAVARMVLPSVAREAPVPVVPVDPWTFQPYGE